MTLGAGTPQGQQTPPGTTAALDPAGFGSVPAPNVCGACGDSYINRGAHAERCSGPDPRPAKRIVDGTAEPLDSGPIDLNYCAVCEEFTVQWHRHHVVGRGQGGDDIPENLVWVCPACHLALHDRSDLTVRGQSLVRYCRVLVPELGEYADRKKWPCYLEDRYLEARF